MVPHRKRSPKPDRRRALELLASSRDGCTEAVMIAHGFTSGCLLIWSRTDRTAQGPRRDTRNLQGRKAVTERRGGHP